MAPNPDMLLRQGQACVNAGDHAGAIDIYTRFLRSAPSHPSRLGISIRVGQLMMLAGRHTKSVAHLKKVVDRNTRDTDAIYALAQAQAFASMLADATATVERLLAIDPDHAEGIARRATLLNYIGRAEEGGAVLDEAAARGIRHWSIELALAGLAPGLGRMEESVDRMRAMVDAGGLDKQEHAELLFNTGYLLDKLGRYDEAWESVTRGNALEPGAWDAGAFTAYIDGLIQTQTPGALRALPEPMDRASDVVLILGSPRSGTTLLEQIIASHPQAATAGELSALHDALLGLTGAPGGAVEDPRRVRPADMIKASGAYLSELRARAGKATRRIDKSPPNWQLLGTGSRVLPEARAIFSERDPRDTAISCVFRHFLTGNHFTKRLDWLGVYLAGKQRLVRHWERVLPEAAPGLRFTRAVYENVVASPEPEARRLVEFAGLEWDDACLRFGQTKKIVTTLNADQTGKGVYTGSAQRWRRYEKHLEPLLGAMGDEAPTD